MRNNNNKGSRSNVNKHELVYGESSSFVLLLTIFIIVVTQKLVLQQSENVTAKCTETLLPLLVFNSPWLKSFITLGRAKKVPIVIYFEVVNYYNLSVDCATGLP